MKDFIAVSLAISAAAMSRSDVMSAVKTANNDPEALATSLLQCGQASDTRDAGDCANMTGYEHCTKCAMPSIQNLVTSLFAVQTEVWTDQKTVADQAASVCNAAFPADRYGGNAKVLRSRHDRQQVRTVRLRRLYRQHVQPGEHRTGRPQQRNCRRGGRVL